MKKLTEDYVKQIIDEEIRLMIESGEIDEGFLDRMKARGASALSRAGSTAKSAGKSFGAGVTGAKAAVATALGADAAKLRDKQRAQQAAAVDAKAQGDGKADAAKIKSILSAHFERMKEDLEILGLYNKKGAATKISYLLDALEDAIDAAAEDAKAGE